MKYLLDFGKRRIIPDVVKKHGTVVEEPFSEKRKFWLDESHVPLHLLKNFEEKRVARKSDKVVVEKSCEVSIAKTKSQKKRGFIYLFSKAEKSEYIVCGHCKKDVQSRCLSPPLYHYTYCMVGMGLEFESMFSHSGDLGVFIIASSYTYIYRRSSNPSFHILGWSS